MTYEIKRVAVIGSGVMGAAIAAQFANIGLHTILLDIVPHELLEEEKEKKLTLENKEVRNRYGIQALERMKKEKPCPFTSIRKANNIQIGNMEDDITQLAEVDWIVEAITEKKSIKKALFQQINTIRKESTIVTSNTSSLSIQEMAEGQSEDFQQHFLGMHFFNPPRFNKLVEIIPSKKTDPSVLTCMRIFAEEVLGKVVIVAKDTPNFIANRIGAFGFLSIWNEMLRSNLRIDMVDHITGKGIGRPKTATFQTLDIVGVDTFYYVINQVQGRNISKEEQALYQHTAFFKEMVEKDMLGRKKNKGFYKKTAEGVKVLDYRTMTYINRVSYDPIGTQSIAALIREKNEIGTFLWRSTAPFLQFTANMLEEIADTIYAIDQAMETGFNWKEGPFHLWDKIGLIPSIKRMEQESLVIPSWIKDMINSGFHSFYIEKDGRQHYYHKGSYIPVPKKKGSMDIKELKNKQGILLGNKVASLLEIGDNVLYLDMHSGSNAIGLDLLTMLEKAMNTVENGQYVGLVIGSEEKHFSLGANLPMMLVEAQNGDADKIEAMVDRFQQTMKRIKYCKKPIVVAAHHRTFGGGAEICLHAAHVQAARETYIGLVETGVGLIPGGGGTKELYVKRWKESKEASGVELLTITEELFEIIFTATVAYSADEALELGFLTKKDGITNNDFLCIQDGKQAVMALNEKNYFPPSNETFPVSGKKGYKKIMKKIEVLKKLGMVSDYDAFIAEKLATVLTGGNVEYGAIVEEDYLLSIEKQAFISLVMQEKTQERMLHLLQTGKPLRN